MDAEVLECAFNYICIRFNIANSRASAVCAENGEGRSLIFGVKVCYARALSASCAVEHIYYRIAFLRDSIFKFFISVFWYAYNIREFF